MYKSNKWTLFWSNMFVLFVCLLALSALQEFNRDQARAIDCGLAMIRRPQKTPKFLLIHGPPGTGKSKTIGGLLYKLLSSVFVFSLNASFPLHALNLQLSRYFFVSWMSCVWLSGQGINSAAPAGNQHNKSRRTRVLLCAPSNAAIDSLMKKVILIFKEKCRNINAPQGFELAHICMNDPIRSHYSMFHAILLYTGNCGDINLVRLGSERTISKSLKPFSLDHQTKARARER